MGSRKHLLGLQPLDSWHLSPPSLKRGALRDRNHHGGASLPMTEAKVRASPQYRSAIHATIWSFVVTFAFALFVVLPWKGQQATLDFFTGCGRRRPKPRTQRHLHPRCRCPSRRLSGIHPSLVAAS